MLGMTSGMGDRPSYSGVEVELQDAGASCSTRGLFSQGWHSTNTGDLHWGKGRSIIIVHRPGPNLIWHCSSSSLFLFKFEVRCWNCPAYSLRWTKPSYNLEVLLVFQSSKFGTQIGNTTSVLRCELKPIVHPSAGALHLVCALPLLVLCSPGHSSWKSWGRKWGLGHQAAVSSWEVSKAGGATHGRGVQYSETSYF